MGLGNFDQAILEKQFGARLRRRQHQYGCGGDSQPASQGRRDRRRQRRALFSGRQGCEPGRGRGKARCTDDADRPAGHRCVRPATAARFLPRKASTSRWSRTPRISIPGRPSSPSPTPTTPSSLCPAPMRWSVPRMSPPPCWPKATSPSASSKFRKLRSPPSSNGRVRPGRPRSSTRRRRSTCGPELLELVDILILNETELGFLAGTALGRYRRARPFH